VLDARGPNAVPLSVPLFTSVQFGSTDNLAPKETVDGALIVSDAPPVAAGLVPTKDATPKFAELAPANVNVQPSLILSAPLIVKTADNVIVVDVEPVMVTDLHAEATSTVGKFAVPVGITTSIVLVGATPPDQLPPALHKVPVPPVHVTLAAQVFEAKNKSAGKIKQISKRVFTYFQ